MYQPSTGIGPFPAVMVVHGAVEVGDKADYAHEATVLADSGLVAFAVNYRLDCDPLNPPPNVDPALCGYHANAPIDDLAAAMQWIRANAATYDAIPTEVGAFGGSSGATFVEMLGTSASGDARPQAVAAWSGESEMWKYDQSPVPQVKTKDIQYIGCPYAGTGSCPQAWYDASAITYVTADDSPAYIANGTTERIPYVEASDLDAALQADGVTDYLRAVPGSMHARTYEDVVVDGCCTTVFDETVAWLHTFLDAAPDADLSLAGTADQTQPVVGQPLTYTWTVGNAGPDWPTGVTLTDQLPAGLDLVSVTPSQGTCQAGPPITCSLGSVPPDAAPTVTIVATPTQTGAVSNTAGVSAAGGGTDPTPADESATVDVTAVPDPTADLALAAKASPNPVTAGASVTYTLKATNGGPDTAHGVVVGDTLSSGETFVSATPSQGTCSGATAVSCSLGDLGPGASATVSLVATPWMPGTVSDPASVASATNDPNGSNDTASSAVVVSPAPGVRYVTVRDGGFLPATLKVPQGATVQWDVDAAAAGPHSATDGTGLALFDTGSLQPGAYGRFVFFGAGAYTVVDTPTGHASSIQVPVTASPTQGHLATTFTLTWASSAAPSGDVFDVQVKRPGSKRFVALTMGTTALGQPYHPDGGTGVYTFRVRLRATVGSVRSGWSPVATVRVS